LVEYLMIIGTEIGLGWQSAEILTRGLSASMARNLQSINTMISTEG
jgi:hypothetical protein